MKQIRNILWGTREFGQVLRIVSLSIRKMRWNSKNSNVRPWNFSLSFYHQDFLVNFHCHFQICINLSASYIILSLANGNNEKNVR